MRDVPWGRLPALGVVGLLLACGGGGGGGGTGPCTPGLATQLVKTSGDPPGWYFDNPLPSALNVTARDANNCAVPGVVVNWAVASGGGSVSPTQDRKSTRLNSSHGYISYAVFCLKKKKKTPHQDHT